MRQPKSPAVDAPARRLLRSIARTHAGALAGAGGATLLITAAELAAPWPLKWLIDDVVGGKTAPFSITGPDLRLLGSLALAVVGIALLSALGTYTGELWLKRSGERISHELRVATYAHLQRLSLAFHDRRAKGDLVTHLTDDANRVGEAFSESLGAIIQAALIMSGMIMISVLLDPVLGLAMMAVVPVLAVVTVHYRRLVRATAGRQRAQEGQIASLATESLSAIRLVQASGSEQYEHGRVSAQSEERRRYGTQVAVLEARFAGMIDVLGAVAMAMVLVIGAFRVSAGVMTAGSIVVFGQYARRLYRPLKDIAKHSTKISKAMARAERIAEVLAADEVLAERPGAHDTGRARGRIELTDVDFCYEPARPVLRGLQLSIPAGSRVALIGASGAGKSSVGALLARFYDPTAGQVTLDGRDLRDCSLRWVRQQVGVLLQDTVLLTGSVADNIAYGTQATREQIEAAARAADAHDFVAALPHGYDELLGPQGVGLSGGQRQRLGIARVLLRDPPILLLDEPTTGLDAASEATVMSGLEALMGGRTSLVVTHSMALASRADRVIVLADGRAVQDGSPSALLATPGLFRRLAGEQGMLARIDEGA